MCMRVEFHHRKNGLSAFLRSLHEVERLGVDLLVDRLHALARQRAGVGDRAVGKAVDHAARAELLLELGALRVVGVLGLFFGVQVVEIAEELVEAVVGRQHLVAVAEVVLAELAGHVALRAQQRRRWSGRPSSCLRGRRAGRPWSGRCGSATAR